jgi:hypothetical protein
MLALHCGSCRPGGGRRRLHPPALRADAARQPPVQPGVRPARSGSKMASPVSLNCSQFVEGQRRSPWARADLAAARVCAGDAPCHSQERGHASTRCDARPMVSNGANSVYVYQAGRDRADCMLTPFSPRPPPRVLVTRGSRCWASTRGTQDASPRGTAPRTRAWLACAPGGRTRSQATPSAGSLLDLTSRCLDPARVPVPPPGQRV